MAVSTLQLQSEDKYTRQAYQRRKDEIYFYDMKMRRAEQAELRAEQTEIENQQLRRENEELRAQLAKV